MLAPEGNPSHGAPANPTHDPNGGSNSTFFYQPGNFNHAFDFSGDGKFEQSALYAASQLSFVSQFSAGGPVVVVALAGIPQRNPLTGMVTQASFVLQAPAGNNSGVTNGSASVPFNTTLVFQAGADAQITERVALRAEPGKCPAGAGHARPIRSRSRRTTTRASAAPPTTIRTRTRSPATGAASSSATTTRRIAAQRVQFPVDGILVGPGGGAAVSGASDAMSILNNANIRYAGGAVPQGSSNFFSAVTLFNSRPAITNTNISLSGGTGGTEAAIGADMDSFREDDTARGPLIRQVTVSQNSLNGIWLMSESQRIHRADRRRSTIRPIPRRWAASHQLHVLRAAAVHRAGPARRRPGADRELGRADADWSTNRLYIQPGVMMKFNKGSGTRRPEPGCELQHRLAVVHQRLSTGPGGYSPIVGSGNIVDESAARPAGALHLDLRRHGDAQHARAGADQRDRRSRRRRPSGRRMWGSVGIQSGAIAVINAATFRYGGGSINTPELHASRRSRCWRSSPDDSRSPLPSDGDSDARHARLHHEQQLLRQLRRGDADRAQRAAGRRPARPARVGPSVLPRQRDAGQRHRRPGGRDRTVPTSSTRTTGYNYIGPIERHPPGTGYANQSVNAVWDLTDLTYVLRGTMILAGPYFSGFGGNFLPNAPVPSQTTYGPIPTPVISLTIQAALPGTLLANGETIPSPGQSVIVKMFNDSAPHDARCGQPGDDASAQPESGASEDAGAGFVVRRRGRRRSTGQPAGRSGCVLRAAHPRHPGQPDDRPAARAGDHHLAARRHGRHDGPRRGDGQHLQQLPDRRTIVGLNAGQSLTTPAAGDGGYIYIGGLLADRVRPDRSRSRAA